MENKYGELRDKVCEIAAGAVEDTAKTLYNAVHAIETLERIMYAERAKEKLKRLAQIEKEAQELYQELGSVWFEDCSSISIGKIYENCTVDADGLKDAHGNLLSEDGACMDEPLGYFVNQTTGYLGDDYYGTMFVVVDDKGTFVAVKYSC